MHGGANAAEQLRSHTVSKELGILLSGWAQETANLTTTAGRKPPCALPGTQKALLR